MGETAFRRVRDVPIVGSLHSPAENMSQRVTVALALELAIQHHNAGVWTTRSQSTRKFWTPCRTITTRCICWVSSRMSGRDMKKPPN